MVQIARHANHSWIRGSGLFVYYPGGTRLKARGCCEMKQIFFTERPVVWKESEEKQLRSGTAERDIRLHVTPWSLSLKKKKKNLDRPSIHRKEEPLEVFDLRQNIRGDATMLFMQTRADRTGQAPKQIHKGASLSRAGTIPHESSTLKEPSESHLPKHSGLRHGLGNKNKILLGHHCGL